MHKRGMGSAQCLCLGLVSVLCVLALVTDQAWAQGVFHRRNHRPQTFTDDQPHLLALNPSRKATLRITVPQPTQLVILFNAECAVAATDNATWVDIDLLVDGVAIAPSSSNNAFCSDQGTNELTGRVSASTQGVIPIASGRHTIQVRATLQGFDAGDKFRIDNLSLIVLRIP